MAREYWNLRLAQWILWKSQGAFLENYPWSDEWPCPFDAPRTNRIWSWGNCVHTTAILPEPYWGNIIDPSVVFININPGCVTDLHSPQIAIPQNENVQYEQIASGNLWALHATQNWHDRFRNSWAISLLNGIEEFRGGLSVELVPWHSKSSSDVRKYILENPEVVLRNLFRFLDVLPSRGVFRKTFVVRSADFMRLLCDDRFSSYFEIIGLRQYTLAREGFVAMSVSFMAVVRLRKEHGDPEFIIFYGGANNSLPSLDYLVLGENMTLREFLLRRNI